MTENQPPHDTAWVMGAPGDSWFDIADRIEAVKAELRHIPEYLRQIDWYRTWHNIDIERLMRDPMFRTGFHAGELWAECQAECKERE